MSGTIFARVSGGPYFTVKQGKQKKDYDNNGYSEFVDPWGRPYMYRAYPAGAYHLDEDGVDGVLDRWYPTGPYGLLQTTPWGTGTPADPFTGTPADPYYVIYQINANLRLSGTVGRATITNCVNPNYNGTFDITGTDFDKFKVVFGIGAASDPGTNAVTGNEGALFPLRNPQTCDVYSLGPNGVTASANRPLQTPWKPKGEWKPWEWKPWNPADVAQFHFWTAEAFPAPPASIPGIWFCPGAGNDVDSTTGNVVVNEKDKDDINNW